MRAEGQINIGREEVAFSEGFVNLLQGCDSRLHIAKSSALKGWCPSLELLLAAGSQPARADMLGIKKMYAAAHPPN